MFKTHFRQIQNIFKNFCKNFGDENIFGPKFLLNLSYDSYNIHVQNTFPTDSKQIQNKLELSCTKLSLAWASGELAYAVAS